MIKLVSRPAPGQESAIFAQNLKKSYGPLVAVDNISFTIKKQEIVGILGPNGAGKTTLIRLLTGVFPLPKGSAIEIFGIRMAKEPSRCKAQFGIVPEVSSAFLDYTVWQNLRFVGRIYGLSRNTIKTRSTTLLAQFDLADKVHALAKTLSKGLKQRLNFCMALLPDSPILILDEPTSGLDPISTKLLRDHVYQLRAAGKTILLTTHDMLEAQKLCDRVLIINHGKLIVDESPDSLRHRFGSAKTLLFKCEAPISEGTRAALEECFTTEIMLAVLKNGYYQLTLAQPAADITKLMSFFERNKILLSDIKLEEATLEDVFIHLIQEGIQEGGTPPE